MAEITPRDGERLIADKVSSKGEYALLLKHLFAYDHLKYLSSPSHLGLEVGFGSGYGSAHAAKFFKKLIALETDIETLAYAREHYPMVNLEYQIFDGKNLPFPDNHFDLAYAFQVIEHINEDRAFLVEAKRVLKPGGRLVLTTPNRLHRLKDNEPPWNRFHVREYSPSQFSNLVQIAFNTFSIAGVKGRGELQDLELRRVHRGRSSLRPLRRLLPKRVKLVANNFLNCLKKSTASPRDYRSLYKIEDYYLDDTDLASSLDLMVVATK